MGFPCDFHDNGYAKFFIILLLHAILKIIIGYYIYNINSHHYQWNSTK